MISHGSVSIAMGVANGGAGRSERLHENALTALRRLMAEPVEGFATIGGSVEPIAPPGIYRVPSLVVLGKAPTEIYAAFEELAPREEVFPIAATAWEPHPWTRPAVAEIDSTVDGLDLSAPLGQRVEISVLNVRLPYGREGEPPIDIDTALLLAAQGWRLLVESLEYSDYPSISGHLALSTDEETIDERLGRGAVRSC